MYQYFLLNILISLLLVITVNLLKTAPARVKFRLLCVALFSWLIPFDYLKNWLASYNIQSLSTTFTHISQNLENTITQQLIVDTMLSWQQVVFVLCLMGFIVFLVDVWKLTSQLRKLNSHLFKTQNGTDIYSSENLNAAYIVGILKPRILIDKSYKNQAQYNSIIAHELQHLKTNDHLWLLLISLVQRLLWWNPLVTVLCLKIRQYIELACDEATSKQVGRENYQQDLAGLMMNQQSTANPILINNIFAKEKFNIFRIKQLSEEFNMKTNHKITITSTLVLLTGLLFFSLQSISKSTSTSTPKSDINFDAMPIKDNQAKIVLDAHLYFDDEKIELNAKDKTANLKTNYNSHKSFAANFVIDLNENFSLKASELKDFEIDILPTLLKDGSIFFETNINFTSLGETIKLNPSLVIKRHDTGHIILNDDNGRYKFEFYITVRQ